MAHVSFLNTANLPQIKEVTLLSSWGMRNLSARELKIKEVALISTEEYHAYVNNIPPVEHWPHNTERWWWTRSPSYSYYTGGDTGTLYHKDYKEVYCIHDDGSEHKKITNQTGCIRPIIKITNLQELNLKEKDTFRMEGYTWTVISSETAICNNIIGNAKFSGRNPIKYRYTNEYASSNVKKFLRLWAKEHGIA